MMDVGAANADCMGVDRGCHGSPQVVTKCVSLLKHGRIQDKDGVLVVVVVHYKLRDLEEYM
jgi:hypothetical protein